MYNLQSWPQSITLQSANGTVGGIVSSATYNAGALPLNGSLIGSDGNYVNGKPCFVIINATANESSNTFTFTGLDIANRTYEISVTGPNATTLILEIPFYKILPGGITMTNNASGNISIDTSSLTATPWVPFFLGATPLNGGINVTVPAGDTLEYTIEYTQDPIFGPTVPTNIQPDQTLINQTGSGTTPIPYATNACRLRYSSWTSGAAIVQIPMAGANSRKNF